MRTRTLMRVTSLAAAISLLATAAAPALAAPVPSSTATLGSLAASPLTPIRWRGRHWHGHRGSGGAVAAGILGGLLLGGIIASQTNRYGSPYYDYGPPGYYGPAYQDWLDYCFSRYRSFDPRTGTYLGYDGYRHYCR